MEKRATIAAILNEARSLQSRGDLGGAERVLHSACNDHGDDTALLAELGNVYLQGLDWPAAAEVYEALVASRAHDHAAREHLVYALARSGRPADAVDTALQSPLQGAERARSLAASADGAFELRRFAVAAALYREAYAADPDNFAAKIGLSQVYRSRVPRWHFGMLNDSKRNAAYESAIAETVRPGDVVFEIGTGAGLLAMMAVRAGAGHVYTCEYSGTIAQKAKAIIAANGLAEKISVVPKLSTKVRVGQDLPRRADVLICEIADNLLIGEGILAATEHARAELITPNARLLPRSGRIRIVPIEGRTLHALDRVDRAAGFDLSLFNEFSRFGNLSVESVREEDFEPLGDAATVFDFDFTDGVSTSETKKVEISCTRDGLLHGVMVWFDLSLTADISISNYPGRDCDHWGHAFFLLDQPSSVIAGETVSVIARHDTTTVDIAVAGA